MKNQKLQCQDGKRMTSPCFKLLMNDTDIIKECTGLRNQSKKALYTGDIITYDDLESLKQKQKIT